MSAYYNDNDPMAAAWLRDLIEYDRIPDGVVSEKNVSELHEEDIHGHKQVHLFAGIAGWPDDVPVWTLSLPCQPFSNAGRKGGSTDERHLWPVVSDLIHECRPTILFGEQVASPAGRTWLASLRVGLEAMDYAVGAADLCAASVGAPHARQRLWWVAYTPGVRLPQSRELRADAVRYSSRPFWEANRLVHAVRRGALPFVCLGHNGVPERVARIAVKGAGNAIVPTLAAEFISASIDAISESR